MLKYNYDLSNYDYSLSFDLAKHTTGWALVDIKNRRVIMSGAIIVQESLDSVWDDLYRQIVAVIQQTQERCLAEQKAFFVVKEKLPNQVGAFTTIASLQALAQTHAVWELACVHTGAEVYDFEGVHAVSVKAFFKRQYGIDKPQKEDIARCVEMKYSFQTPPTSMDITDAVAVVQTLTDYKWNADIKEHIKQLKKDLKKYKSPKKIRELTDAIENVQRLLISDIGGK